MDLILIFGYLAALVVGISLGIIGGGGSILTVPVLVYLFQVDAMTSTAYSLFIVGTTALVGAVRSYMHKSIDLRTGIIFAIPSLTAVWLTRAFIIPLIPSVIYTNGDFILTDDIAILLFFAVIMLLSSFSMIRSGKDNGQPHEGKRSGKDNFYIVLEGLAVGTVTGLVGAGGGFLIIPALVLLARLPMKIAVGTSLMIIAVKSLIGFTGDLMNPQIFMDWPLLFTVTGLAVVGIFIGISLRNVISGDSLKKGFGYFLLVMGIYMITERLMQIF